MNSKGTIRIVTICLLIIHGLAFLAPFELFPVGTKGYEFGDLGITVFLLYSFKRLIWDGDRLEYIHFSMLSILLLLLLFSIVSGITPIVSSRYDHLVQFIKSSLHFVYLVLFAIISLGITLPLKNVVLIVKGFLLSAIPVNLYALYQTPARAFDWPWAYAQIQNTSLTYRNAISGEEQKQLVLSFEGFFRATSFFSEPSALASFNMLTLCFLLTPLMLHDIKAFKNKYLFYFILYISFIGLFLTFSLTAVFQLVLLVGLILLVNKGRKFIKVLTFAVVLTAMVFVTDYYVESYADISVLSLYKQRVFSILKIGGGSNETISGESFDERSAYFTSAIKIWGKRPLFGTGIGCLQYVKTPEGEVIIFSTSGYSESFGVTGVFGGLSFLGLNVIILLYGFMYYNSGKSMKLEKDETMILCIIPFFATLLVATSISGNTLIDTSHWSKIVLFFYMLNALRIKTSLSKVRFSFYQDLTPKKLLTMNVRRM